jgi:hypothetical protein
MVGVNPPGHFLWDAKTTREQIRRYATHCARDESCRSRTDDLAASLDSAFDRIPSRSWFLPIKKGNVRMAALFGLFNATSDGGGPFATPLMIDLLLSVDEGDASGAWLLSTLVQAVLPRMQVAGDAAAMGLTFPHLPNGHQVVLPKLGNSEDFWAYQPAASTRLIATFLDSGREDTSLYTENRLDFTPSFTYGAMAKIVLGVMLGLAVLTVLSLCWMALRVRRRGPFGRKASGALRSLYVLLLGLGGLLLGMLTALTALPTVPLYDELLATLSVAAPVGLGLYLAWVNPAWSARTKNTGFTAAAAGASPARGWGSTHPNCPWLS